MPNKSSLAHLGNLYASAVSFLNLGQPLLLLAVRLYWGWQLMQSGWGKLHHIAQVTDFFTSLGLPQPHLTAILVSLLELVGGALFTLGLGSRIISLMLFINMCVAYWTADREALGAIFSDPGKFYNADPYTFWFSSLMVLVFGPGVWAIDTLIRRFSRRETLDSTIY
ncbi:DoxX family protein [Acidicapsa ligni]|uniref:DoxX family protein n=1 Tax=Acidicapsa ligni TaxID=542300 RepID=UPI0021E01BB4|nr:DoxX family protein [Acidicapsa ligni]